LGVGFSFYSIAHNVWLKSVAIPKDGYGFLAIVVSSLHLDSFILLVQ